MVNSFISCAAQASREQMCQKLFHLSGAGECHSSFMEATGGSVKMFMGANELTQPQHRNAQREPKRHVGHISVVFIERHSCYYTHIGAHTA